MDTNLQHIIRSKQALQPAHCQYFMYQMLAGLKYLHSAGIVHRDFRPLNLLVDKECGLIISFFREAHQPTAGANLREPNMTEYVVTRWYNAPEAVPGISNAISTASDIWSLA